MEDRARERESRKWFVLFCLLVLLITILSVIGIGPRPQTFNETLGLALLVFLLFLGFVILERGCREYSKSNSTDEATATLWRS